MKSKNKYFVQFFFQSMVFPVELIAVTRNIKHFVSLIYNHFARNKLIVPVSLAYYR